MTFDELKAKLWGAAQILRGSIDAGGYKEYVFPLVFFKRICDVHREEYRKALAASGDEEFARLPENCTFAIPEGCDWEDVRTVTANVGQALTTAFLKIEQANPSRQIGERRVEGLEGIFGSSGIWRNKNILSDEAITGLIENFSQLDLSLAACPADEMGNAYEYLVGKFADDAGNTAQEFYTNRTVVELMAEILEPKSGESIYDPTCGTGGMLISCIARCKRHEENWREIKAYGQEQNALTSSVARMNLFLHGVEEFRIVNDDTLLRPGFTTGGALQTFDVVLANPPYSIKQWNRELFANDPYGRNFLGTPPQGRADYAFIQHIFKSMDPVTGRCAILLPHGVLFREEEDQIRKALIESDLVEAVIGLGPNLFYNSPMEACIMICRAKKSAAAQGRVMFINAVNEVTRKNGESKLEPAHIAKILNAYRERLSDGAFAYDATVKEIADRAWSLNISLYAHVSHGGAETRSLSEVLCSFARSDATSAAALDTLAGMVGRAVPRAPQPQSNAVCVGGSVAVAKGLAALPAVRVRLGDVAEEVRGNWEGSTTGVPVVGLEHLDPDDIWLRRWEADPDENTFTKGFKKGQILFGRRRAYQKKLSLAPCDGICSGDITVIAAKPETVLPELLPFYLRTDAFFDYAVRGSGGSLSPRVKWSHISNYEFSLPPLAEQKKLAELLWAANDLKEAYKRMIAATDEMLKAKFREMFGEKEEGGREKEEVGAGDFNTEAQRHRDESHAEMRRGGEDIHAEPQRRRAWPIVRFEEICSCGPQNGFYRKGAEENGSTPTLKMKQLFGYEEMALARDCDCFNMTPEEIAKYRLTRNDLVFGRRSIVHEGAGKCRRVGDLRCDTVFESSMLRVTLKVDKAIPRWVQAWTEFGSGEIELAKMRSGTTIVGIKGSDLKNMPIPLPPLPLQREFVEIARAAEEAKAALKKSIADVEQVIRGLVNK